MARTATKPQSPLRRTGQTVLKNTSWVSGASTRRKLRSEPSRRVMRTKKYGFKFPKKFLWGSASASHQVNGSGPFRSNWKCFEESGKRRQFLLDKGVPEDQIHEFIAGDACQFESRFRADFALLKALGHNSVRFSINWAIIQPERGKFNIEALENYRAMMHEARRCGLKVVLTLYHWTHPMWFEEAGGWTQSDAAEQFYRMIHVALPYLGKLHYVTTLNEPNVYLLFSYRWTEWPPGMGSDEAHDKAMAQMIEAHSLVYKLIKKRQPNTVVGVAMAVNWNQSNNPEKKELEDRFFYNWLDVWASRGHLDVIGVQTYMHSYWDTNNEANNRFGWDGHDPCPCAKDNPVQSDMRGVKHERWGMCPEAIYHAVKEVWDRYRIPMMVTEHGHSIAEIDDHKRCWFIWETIPWLERLLQEGVQLLGYLHWSTMDNFEWLYGFRSKFGLIHINLVTQKRTPRKSAYLYRSIIRNRGRTAQVKHRFRDFVRHPHEKPRKKKAA